MSFWVNLKCRNLCSCIPYTSLDFPYAQTPRKASFIFLKLAYISRYASANYNFFKSNKKI